jgi:hypothetical protein
MKCQRCGTDLAGGRGAYAIRCEATAVGEDVSLTPDEIRDQEALKEQLFEQLEAMSAEELERDVYQLWEGGLCRECRKELGEVLGGILE